MKPVMKSKVVTQRCKTLHQYKGMGKSKKHYVKRLSQVLNQVHPTTIQQHWAMDQLSTRQAGSALRSLVALEAARLSCSQPRNTITSKYICTAVRNLQEKRTSDPLAPEI